MSTIKIFFFALLFFFFSGCSAYNMHINNLKNKNKSLYSIFEHAKTVLVIDKSSPNYETFKKLFTGNGNFTTSKKIEECKLAGTTYCCYTAESKYNTFDEYKKCIGSEYYEPVYTTSIQGVSEAITRKRVAIAICSESKTYDSNLDFNACVNRLYKPEPPKVNTTVSGIIVRIKEDNIYGIIQRNLERKGITHKPYDLFTEYKIGIIEVDEKNVEIVISAGGSVYISPTYGVNQVPKIEAGIVQLLNSLNIKYKYAE